MRLADTRAWADAIAALPAAVAGGAIARRVVIVPREAVAHALRRELIASGRASALAGTRFVRAVVLAEEQLRAAGVRFTSGEERLRAIRIEAVLGRGGWDEALGVLAPIVRRVTPGWGRALARTIGDLEAAGLRSDTLAADDAPPIVRDLATIWRAIDRSAGASWTDARIFAEAMGRPHATPFPVLAAFAGDEAEVERRYVASLPAVRIAHFSPSDRSMSDRHGRNPPTPATTEGAISDLALLQRDLFADPAVLADRHRLPATVASHPDGTVELEEHAGIDDELHATTDWVARHILAGVALEDLAVLVAGPAAARVVPLVADRLARLPWPSRHRDSPAGHGPPIVELGGASLRASAPVARALAVLRAVRAHLPVDRLAALLPALRTDGAPLTIAAAHDLAWSLGTAGGDPARPHDALAWDVRASARERELLGQLAALAARPTPESDADDDHVTDDVAPASTGRRDAQLTRRLDHLRAIRPALAALVALARAAQRPAPLAELVSACAAFVAAWIVPDAREIADELVLALAPACADRELATLTGDAALAVIEDALGGLRRAAGRPGDPAIHVGPLAAAVGVPFHAVRVIGLSEGALPAPPDEDPLLPDAERARLSPAIARAADRAAHDRLALHRVICDTRGAIALSAPRVGLDRGARAASSVLVDASAALGRTYAPAQVTRRAPPLAESAWHDAVAHGAAVPPWWQGAPELDLARLAGLAAGGAGGPNDGMLGGLGAALAPPGLSPDRHISASRLRTLLECPQRFLFDTLLGWHEPERALPLRALDARAFGELVHRIAEDFFGAHGAAFSAREETLAVWAERARPLTDRRFDEHLEGTPLVGAGVREQERARVHREIAQLLEIDWNGGAPRRFVGVELPFGDPMPLRLPIGDDGTHLYVRGYIDRLDVDGGVALVRDLKTGRPHPRTGRERDPDPVIDVQIALYALVVRELAALWDVPAEVAAAYVYTGAPDRGERGFHGADAKLLADRARAWLHTAAALLEARAFPHTPRSEDCTFCPFRVVCGEDVFARAAASLAAAPADSPLAAFRALKPMRSES